MAKRYKRSKLKRRRSKLSASNAGPILAFLMTILGVIAVAALVVFVALPQLLPLVGVEFNAPWKPTPTPAPTARPTATPHPIIAMNPIEAQHEVVLPNIQEYAAYRWMADPYAYGNRLLFVAGKLMDTGDIHMDTLFSLDISTGEITKINVERKNQDIMYPVCNDTWLVYLDGQAGGGGAIRAMRWDTGETVTLKTVYTGQPRLHLDGNTLAFMERTGSYMDKLFLLDLVSKENVTVETFSSTAYGQSDISIHNGELVYAFEDNLAEAPTTDEKGTSGIYRVKLGGTADSFNPGTYVHDPKTNGVYWVWRDGLHGENNSLYISKGGSSPRRIAENIIDYGLSDTFVAYSKNGEPIKIYLFDNDMEIAITPDVEREQTQLLGVSNGVVIWMDVTSRKQDVMKYVKVE